MDFFWRRRAACIIGQWGALRILDLATGSGDLALATKARCPGATIVAVDFCAAMLHLSQRKGVRHLVCGYALTLPFAEGAFDAAAVAFGLRNFNQWAGALIEIARVLRNGGRVLILDFSRPCRPLRWIYTPYLHLVLPRLAGLLTGEKTAYDYLANSIEAFPEGREMCALLRQMGFSEVTWMPLSGGIAAIYTAVKRKPKDEPLDIITGRPATATPC